MAEGILRNLAVQARRADLVVSSAGTLGIVGAPATDEAIQVARSHGIDIAGHVSSALTAEMMREAAVVLAMTELHVDELRERFPDAADRTHLLSIYADGSDTDVPDPIGGPVEEYERVFGMIEGYLASALPKLVAMSRGDEEEVDSGRRGADRGAARQ